MGKYSIEEICSIAKDMKYEALYWTLGFIEYKKGIFEKEYTGLKIVIDSERATVNLDSKISIVNSESFKLDSHKSFVVLECIDKLLSMGYLPSEIIIDFQNEYDIYCKDLYIKCFEWNHAEEDNVEFKKDYIKSITYESRLVSGVIERRTSIKTVNGIYDVGIFENDLKQDSYCLSRNKNIESKDFIIENSTVVKYVGSNSKVVVPEGITALATSLFWDNQNIEEVVLPKSLINLGGDTFYNCFNLKKVNIPINVKFMGNNPFAGCPKLDLVNESNNFNFVDGVLYNKDFSKLIYCSIKQVKGNYHINESTKIVGKHSFYLCDEVAEITIPKSVIKLENNPFSGCSKLDLINNSDYYHVVDKVIYDKDKKSVIGCLNSINSDELILLHVDRICRNSFWNCKGIKKIVLPKTLKAIGYNPFVGCSNIEFVSESSNYEVINNALYTENRRRLVCYPAKYAVGNIHLPDEVITLERGAFSGCNKLTSINLHNVSIISKTCFTNCDSLENVYCSDLVGYIGEWAFAHCKNLKEVSVYRDCFLDKNILSNSEAKLVIRSERSNYIIQSDNLFTLESLKRSYSGKIKSIVIDPPYNSNIDYIGYKDSEFEDGYTKFIKDRILLSYDLLSEDGYLVINIDKGEYKNLSKVCKSIFSKVRVCKWEKLHKYFDANREVKRGKKKVRYEYIILCSKSNLDNLNLIKQPYLKNNELLEKESAFPRVFRCFGTNSSAKDEIKDIFGDRNFFRTPKPVKLIKEFVRATSNKNSIILDFFAGSGTTGHAVEDLNKEDGGSRRYILVTNDESDICRRVTCGRLDYIKSKYQYLN